MTSKNLFFKLIRQDFKKRIWCPILIFIGYFLALEVNMLMSLEHILKRQSVAYDAASQAVSYVAHEFFGTNIILIAVIMCGAAFLCALSGFAYLHSKVQIDTYHSMPVSRGTLFWSRYVSGVLQCMLPFMIHVVICLAIAASKGALSSEGIGHAFCFIGTELLIFMLSYSVSILAVCLTGNMIISILGTGVLFSCSTLIVLLQEILFSRFFDTFVLFWHEEKLPFSPLGMLIRLGNAIDSPANGFHYGSITGELCMFALAIVIYTALSCVLYWKRPSEAAGKAIAFGWAEPIIKFIIVLPCSLYSGLFFEEISVSDHSFGWFLFGAVFGFVIICLLMEVIFRMDIRGALEHKKQFLFNAACTALLIIILQNDVLGYDTYVPSDKQLQSCAVSINGLMDYYLREINEYGSIQYTSMEEYRMNTMQIQGNPSVMELARKAAKEGLQYSTVEYYEGVEDTPEYQAMIEQRENYHQITFGYQLLNGKQIYRTYLVDISDAQTYQLLSAVFADEQYKLGSSPILNSGWSEEYVAAICKNNFYQKRVALTEERQAKLLQAYQSDLMKLTFDDAIHTIPVGTIQFKKKEELDNYQYYYSGYSSRGTYHIYPQFTDTIAILKEYGFDLNEQMDVEDISSIEIINYQIDDDAPAGSEAAAISSANKVYTDKAEIAQILASIARDEFRNNSYQYIGNLYEGQFEIKIRRSDGSTDTEQYRDSDETYYYFIKGKVPEFCMSELLSK